MTTPPENWQEEGEKLRSMVVADALHSILLAARMGQAIVLGDYQEYLDALTKLREEVILE